MLCRLVGERLEEGDEGFLIVGAERHTSVGMFREIRVERRATFRARAIVVDDLFKSLETPVMHVGLVSATLRRDGMANLPLSNALPVTRSRPVSMGLASRPLLVKRKSENNGPP